MFPMVIRIFLMLFFIIVLIPVSLQAQESPEAVYQKWVEYSRAGDIQGLLSISSADKVKEFHEDYPSPEKQEEIRKLMKVMAPTQYKINKTVLSPDGNKASLFMDMTAVDFFKLQDPKPEKEKAQVLLVKEKGQWKIDQQCVGPDGCGKEPEWTSASYGKPLTLGPGATLKVVRGSAGKFKGIPVKGDAFAVDFIFTMPENGETLSYFLHRNPSFADFDVSIGGKKITPVARLEDLPNSLSNDDGKPEIQVLEEDYSYSRSTNFNGQGTLSLLFDLPKGDKGDRVVHLTVSYGEKKYSFEVK